MFSSLRWCHGVCNTFPPTVYMLSTHQKAIESIVLAASGTHNFDDNDVDGDVACSLLLILLSKITPFLYLVTISMTIYVFRHFTSLFRLSHIVATHAV